MDGDSHLYIHIALKKNFYPYSFKILTLKILKHEKLSKFKKNISKKQVNSIEKKWRKILAIITRTLKKTFCIRVIFYHTKLFQKKLLLKDRYLLKEIKILYHYFPQK